MRGGGKVENGATLAGKSQSLAPQPHPLANAGDQERGPKGRGKETLAESCRRGRAPKSPRAGCSPVFLADSLEAEEEKREEEKQRIRWTPREQTKGKEKKSTADTISAFHQAIVLQAVGGEKKENEEMVFF